MSHIPVNFQYKIPRLYEQHDLDEQIVYARYTVPNSDWIWNILERSALQNLFYGYVEPEGEFLYFTIDSLGKTAMDYDVNIELDIDFHPIPLKDLL